MKKVSVSMATYNGARFLRQQLDSILPQLGSIDEIIIADDGSTDDTLAIIQSYQDNRIKVLANNHGGSPARSFEQSLHACTGELIFMADQDDVWMPNKIARCAHYLSTFDLVLSDCTIIDERNCKLKESFFYYQNSQQGFARNLIRNSYMGCCMAFTQTLLRKILPFPPGLTAHDQWIGLIAERFFKVFFLPEPLVQYRRHGNNYSFTGAKSTSSVFEKVRHRLNMLYNIYNRL